MLYIIPDYETALLPLFLELIKQQAKGASDRKSYQAVCSIINHFKLACGVPEAKKIVSELLEIYKRRPAFVDELKKLKL